MHFPCTKHDDPSDARDACDDLIRRGWYRDYRGLEDYRVRLGDEFWRRLERLGPGQVWLDGGSGEAEAQRDYLKAYPKGGRVVACDCRPPRASDVALQAARFRFYLCRVTELDPCQVGPVMLITDVYGALSYDADLAGVLERYLTMLRPGGALCALFSWDRPKPADGDQEALFQQQLRTLQNHGGGRPADWPVAEHSGRIERSRLWIAGGYSLTEYLRALGGATVVRHERTWTKTENAAGGILPAPAEIIVLERNSAPLAVPPLALQGMREDLPPFRDYLWPNAPQAADPRSEAMHAEAEQLHVWSEGLPSHGYRRRKRR